MSEDQGSQAYRLSPQQRRIWSLQQSGLLMWAQRGVLIEGGLSPTLLRAALADACGEHEILRTIFPRPGGLKEPLQVVLAHAHLSWEEGFGSPEPGAEEAWAEAVLEQERNRELDFEQGPLLRARLLYAGQDRHLLVLTLPALCADGWTLEILIQEVAERYAAAVEGRAFQREVPPYVQFSEWRNELLEGEDVEAGRAFWRTLGLRSAPRPRLPFESPVEAGGTPIEPRSFSWRLEPELAARLEEAAATAGVPVRAVLLGLWLAFLARITGEPEVVVGDVWHGREHEVLQSVPGPMASCLPVRCSLQPGLRLGGLLRRLDQDASEAGEWQELFLIEETLAEGAEGEAPCFAFGFELEDGEGRAAAAGVTFSRLAQYLSSERFSLALRCRRQRNALVLELQFAPARLSAEYARLLAGQLEAFLRSALENPEASIDELDLLDESERIALTVSFNKARRRRGAAPLIHELIASQAAACPDRVAVVCGEQELTYRELDARAGRLAWRLRSLGVGAEVPVALFLDRSVEAVVAIFAVLKAGGAYVPLDPDAPRERLAAILACLPAPLVVTRRELAHALPDVGGLAVYLEPDSDAMESGEPGPPPEPAPPGQLAYVIFTSGSTGSPKGVAVEHAQLLNYLHGVLERLDLAPGSSFAMVSTFSADLGHTALFPSLCTGGTLHVIPQEQAADPERLAEHFSRHRIDCMKIVPSHLAALLHSPRAAGILLLRVLVLGGDVLRWELVSRVRELSPGCTVINHYGPTESTVGVLTCRVADRAASPFAATVPLGEPIANTQAYVLDRGLNPVARGVAGELFIGGESLARGYIQRPGQTAERFLPNPWSDHPGGRLYATGDLVRHLPEGGIEFLGRVDHQVKIRGFRVELGEIEAALRGQPGVQDAVVVARGDASGHKQLVAYVVPSKREPAAGALQTLPNGLQVHHLNRNETLHLHQQIFADRIYLRHGISVHDGACVFDVGANIGLFTLFIHQSCTAPKVFAFEPSPPTFARLRQNLSNYGLAVELFEGGLSGEEKTATFTHYPRASVMSGFYADAQQEERLFRTFAATHLQGREDLGAGMLDSIDGLAESRFETETYTCRLTTLSRAIRDHRVTVIDLLKIDVEKSELDVLAGIDPEDWGKIQQIVVEVHDFEGRVEQVAALLRNRGFDVVADQDSPLEDTEVYQLYARRPGVAAAGRAATPQDLPSRRIEPLSAAGLREALRERLPEYMLPAVITVIRSLPLTANGKIDRKALPAPEQASAAAQRAEAAPRTPNEELLARIWGEVLGLERVGIHDNFFELGGDSILSIQIVSKAHRAGLRLTPKQVFQQQTIAELAAVGTPTAALRTTTQDPLAGPVPLTPIQHWFFDLGLPNPHHFNQAVLLELRDPLDSARFEAALRQVMRHHDALRFRFTATGSGWGQLAGGPEEEPAFLHLDLGSLSAGALADALDTAPARLQASLDLSRGPLLRAAWLDLGATRGSRLLIVVHHLVVDGVSWRILLEDLETVYRQLGRGEPPSLPPKTTSFQHWSERLVEYARSKAVRDELAYWLAGPAPQASPLPVDHADGENTVASARPLSLSLDPEETTALLQGVPKAYRTQINDVLLTALALACARWTGSPGLWVELEGHGREEIFDDLDLSRTVGWFTTHFPVFLDVTEAEDGGAALKAVKERLRAVPNRGLGYGLLRYLVEEPQVAADLRRRPRPAVKLNYLGQLDQTFPADSPFAPSAGPIGPTQGSGGKRDTLLELNGMVLGGRLVLTWIYSENLFRHGTVERLAQSCLAELRRLISHCLSPEAGGYTPSDFPLARLDPGRLDELTAGSRRIEDIYPLSLLQRGLLFELLYEPASSLYWQQLTCKLQGNLDPAAFSRAVQHAVQRHAVLRTAFHWKGLQEPLQVVYQQVGPPMAEEDWRGLPAGEQSERFAALVRLDRDRILDPASPPLMRLTLVRTAEAEHLLLWGYHHLLIDGWSLAILLREVFAAYEAFAQGAAVELDPVPPYRDYISWLQRQDAAAAEGFWRRTLAGFTTPTPLGADRTRRDPAAVDDGVTEAVPELFLPEAVTGALSSFARRHRLTLNTLVQGSWALLLSRYSGEEEVVFGVTVSGRPAELADAETMVGLFINTLPLRVALPPGALLDSWLAALQERQVELGRYEASSLAEVQRWSEVPAGQPLFESILVFENYPVDASLARLSASLGIAEVRALEKAKYPLAVTASADSRLRLEIRSDPRLFEASGIRRRLEHLRILLEGFVAAPGRRLADLPLLTEPERFQLLVEWSDSPAEVSGHCIHELFEEQAEKSPDAVAVVFGRERLTYRELDQRANRLAHHLRALGVGPEVRVGLCVERSPEMLVGMLGVLKAGGAYVPLDPGYPKERLVFMGEDCGAAVLLTQERLATELPAGGATVVCLDSASPAIDLRSDRPVARGSHPDNPAYVIYTSGSTGRPKGAVIPHRALVSYAVAAARQLDLRAADRVLQFAALSFDVAVEEIFPAWLAGAAVVLRDPFDLASGEGLLQAIAEDGVTVVELPTAFWHEWVYELSRLGKALPACLRLVLIGGEQVLPDRLEAWQGLGVPLVHVFGLTEVTVTSTLYPVPAGAGGERRPGLPIGRPFGGNRTYVLDVQLRPVPIGGAGELYLGGACLARGYWRRPELTAERFVPDPFSPEPGERLYRTGDLARHLPDGNLEFLGRIDQQVKVRGYRIEPGEVEAVLARHPAVREAVVLAREDGAGGKRLVAYLVMAQQQNGVSELSVAGLRAFLAGLLPEHMIPSDFVVLAALPLTPNGKVDRRALPAPEGKRLDPDAGYVAPRTETEEQLARIWSEVLGLGRVGIRDNFFELGGHSLNAMQVIVRLNEALRMDIPIRALFLQPTLQDFAASLDASRSAAVSEDTLDQQMQALRERILQLRSEPEIGAVEEAR